MSKKAFITVALVAFTAAAHATNWVFLDMATHRCVSAKAFAAEHGAPAFASPLAMRNVFRDRPGWKGVKIHSIGKLGRAVILREKSRVFFYFSSLAGCQTFRAIAIANGTMPNLNALR